jgi:hypothetical protein
MTTKPPLQRILQGILHTESETQHNHERAGSTINVQSNIDLGTHNQTLKQLRQLNDRNHHIPTSTNT